jgi:RNA-directed DNA polymerase
VEGTPQGAVISPLLANVYLHYVYDLWVRQWRQRHAKGDVIVVRYADDTIIGFEHQQDAERFLADLSARLAEFGLGLHPDKTRLIEFGRNAIANHRSRGLGKPKTFDFLGFTHYCATRRSGSGFVLGRTPIRSRTQTKLREIKEQLRATRHDGIEAQGQWLAKVLRGWLAYYAVPMSAPAITAFRHHLIERWLRAIRRRGQKHRLPWRRMKLIANRYLPYPRILHHGLNNGSSSHIRGRSPVGSTARRDLCGGRPVMVVPTATPLRQHCGRLEPLRLETGADHGSDYSYWHGHVEAQFPTPWRQLG